MWTSPLQGLSRIWETGLSCRRIGASVSTDSRTGAGGQAGKKERKKTTTQLACGVVV